MSAATLPSATAPIALADRRADFPILQRQVHGKPLVYLDNAATTQKPQSVIDRLTHYYEFENANVHRGVHLLSQEGTDAYEAAREAARQFIGAEHAREIIFTRGTTDAINLVARSLGDELVHEGDEILISELEHHANIVPWQMLAERRGATVRAIPMDEAGELVLDELDTLINERTRIVAVGHTSNALGTVNDLATIIDAAHERGIPVVVDAAQGVVHGTVNVVDLGADFLTFSGHKVYGPTGIGVLYGQERWLERMPPFLGGGDMIDKVSITHGTTFAGLPSKFEAGTPHVAGALGLHAALDYVSAIGMQTIADEEASLLDYAVTQLSAIDGLTLVGTPRRRAGAISFLLDGMHPYDAGSVLDRLGIAVRTGHHCAQPIMERLGVPGTIRASFALYSTQDDVDALVDGIAKVQTLFA